jgi:hypothetical protein
MHPYVSVRGIPLKLYMKTQLLPAIQLTGPVE